MGKWQILYLRTRYRSKLGWLFWFGLIHVTICCNLKSRAGKLNWVKITNRKVRDKYRVTHLLANLGWVDQSPPKSTQPRSARRCVALYNKA